MMMRNQCVYLQVYLVQTGWRGSESAYHVRIISVIWDVMWLQMTVFSSPPTSNLLSASLPHLPSQAVRPQFLCVTEGCGVTNLVLCFRLCKLRGSEDCWSYVSRLYSVVKKHLPLLEYENSLPLFLIFYNKLAAVQDIRTVCLESFYLETTIVQGLF